MGEKDAFTWVTQDARRRLRCLKRVRLTTHNQFQEEGVCRRHPEVYSRHQVREMAEQLGISVVRERGYVVVPAPKGHRWTLTHSIEGVQIHERTLVAETRRAAYTALHRVLRRVA